MLQLAQLGDPAEDENIPAKHEEHSDAETVEYLPAGQTEADERPIDEQYDSEGHSRHALSPVEFW